MATSIAEREAVCRRGFPAHNSYLAQFYSLALLFKFGSKVVNNLIKLNIQHHFMIDIRHIGQATQWRYPSHVAWY